MISPARVIEVTPDENWLLHLAFDDGKTGTFDMKPYLVYPGFQPLKNIDLFFAAHVEAGTVVWNDDIDIAPERLYSDCQIV